MCWEVPREWNQWLSLAEWWYNTNFHTSTKATPHELLYGQKTPVYVPYVPQTAIVEAVDRSFAAREKMIAVLKHHLHRSANNMKQKADLKRSNRDFK